MRNFGATRLFGKGRCMDYCGPVRAKGLRWDAVGAGLKIAQSGRGEQRPSIMGCVYRNIAVPSKGSSSRLFR